MAIDKIVLKNIENFDQWDQEVDEHFDPQYRRIEMSDAERERIFFQTNKLLMGIADNFFIYGKFKDNWDTSKCYINVFGQNLLLRSEKMNLTFQWGLEKNDFYLETYIIYPENLRYMTDEFWITLLELKALGEFNFLEMGSLNAEERPYFENKTSTVFQMIRNFMLFQIEKKDGTNYQQPPQMELGQFILKWDAGTTQWSDLIEKTCKAFKLLYTINYQLWKIADLAKKKISKY